GPFEATEHLRPELVEAHATAMSRRLGHPVDDGVAGGEHVEPASHVVRARGVRHEEGVLGWEGEDAGLVIEDPGGRQPGEDLGRVALVALSAALPPSGSPSQARRPHRSATARMPRAAAPAVMPTNRSKNASTRARSVTTHHPRQTRSG